MMSCGYVYCVYRDQTAWAPCIERESRHHTHCVIVVTRSAKKAFQNVIRSNGGPLTTLNGTSHTGIATTGGLHLSILSTCCYCGPQSAGHLDVREVQYRTCGFTRKRCLSPFRAVLLTRHPGETRYLPSARFDVHGDPEVGSGLTFSPSSSAASRKTLESSLTMDRISDSNLRQDLVEASNSVL